MLFNPFMKLSTLQQFGFAVLVFGLGCASSLWLESSSPTNHFYQEGAIMAGPMSLPSNTNQVETRTPREELESRRALEGKPAE